MRKTNDYYNLFSCMPLFFREMKLTKKEVISLMKMTSQHKWLIKQGFEVSGLKEGLCYEKNFYTNKEEDSILIQLTYDIKKNSMWASIERITFRGIKKYINIIEKYIFSFQINVEHIISNEMKILLENIKEIVKKLNRKKVPQIDSIYIFNEKHKPLFESYFIDMPKEITFSSYLDNNIDFIKINKEKYERFFRKKE